MPSGVPHAPRGPPHNAPADTPMRKSVALFVAVLVAFLLLPVLLAAQEPVRALRPSSDTRMLSAPPSPPGSGDPRFAGG